MPGNVFQQGTLLMHTGPSHHLHIVMNDPVFCQVLGELSVLVVNLSSVRETGRHDTSCILAPGCHPFVRRDSWVVYGEAAVLRLPRLEADIVAGGTIPHLPVSLDVFRAVRAGFDRSPHVKLKIERYIRHHSL